MKHLLASIALAAGLAACHAEPVSAAPIELVTWQVAGSMCTAYSLGLDYKAGLKWGLEQYPHYAPEMRDRLFAALLLRELNAQCSADWARVFSAAHP